MSRADYLAKYLNPEKPKKRKSKKPQPQSTIVVEGFSQFAKPEQFAPPEHAAEPTDADDEFAPVSVEGDATLPNAGFVRIDTGEVVKPAPVPEAQELQHQNTVYRDKSGRIIDLAQKRAELEAAAQEAESQQKALEEQVNTGDMDRARSRAEAEKEHQARRFAYSKTDAEYVSHMSAKPRFDDPLNSFAPREAEPEVSLTGRPTYQGVQALNRFQIASGHFWDGTDRSNGFEERVVEKRDAQRVKKVTETAVQESYTEYDFD